MKSYKCSETEVHQLLAKVLRNPPAKIQRKKKQANDREREEDEEDETGSRCDNEESLTDIE